MRFDLTLIEVLKKEKKLTKKICQTALFQTSKPAVACSKLTLEILEQGRKYVEQDVKYVQS